MTNALQILKQYFGYDSFRPMQEEVISHVVSGRDALVLMPTGGGKSLCYQIPALMTDGVAVVVSPLISLMKDQVDALRSNGIAADALNSNNDESVNRIIRGRCVQGELKILYISPERLILDMTWLRENVKVSLIAIDEAHCISQWGHDFRPEYTQLGSLHEQFPGVPVLALTATADKITKQDIIGQLHLKDYEAFVSSFDRPNLSLDVKRGYTAKDKLRTILGVIKRHKGESGVVYCLSRNGTEKLAEKLRAAGISVGVYHAGLTSEERSRVQEDFINDRTDVICATVAFGMGIDKSNIRYVIHYNLPKSIESFYQEIGRGGRDGLPAETLLFYNLQDIITLRKFADESGQRDINQEKLNRMQEYAEASVCRRRILLNYFGETTDCHCGNCDVCLSPPQMFDGTELVQKALSAIARANEGIGFTVTIDILRAMPTHEVVANGYDKLKTYGAGREVPARDWHDYMLQMLQMGFVEIAYNDNNHLRITPLGREVLKGTRQVQLAVIVREDYRVKGRQKKEKVTSQSQILPDVLSDEDPNLFQRLRELRRQLADEAKKPAYIIMSDRTLHDLAAKRPTSFDALSTVFGIGEHKARQFGETFINAIREYEKENDDLPFKNSEAATTPQIADREEYGWFKGIEEQLSQLIYQKDALEEKIQTLREEIMRQMEAHKTEQISSRLFTVTYTPGRITKQFDSKAFKEQNEELYSSYCIDKVRNPSITVKRNKEEGLDKE